MTLSLETVTFASVYKLNVCDTQDVGAKSKDFNNLSGKYTMELIVGDAVIENPITWLMVSKQHWLAVCARYFHIKQSSHLR